MRNQNVITLLFIVLITVNTSAQVAINTDGSQAEASALLEIKSTEKGVLIPRMTSTQRLAISGAVNGLLVFDADTKSFWFFDGVNTAWIELKGSNNNNQLSDADGDTKIQVEKTNDDDAIRFDMGGTEFFSMQNGRLSIKNTGGSVFIGDAAGFNDDLSNNNNVFVGFLSGSFNTTGEDNAAFGYRTLYSNQTGSNNTAVGSNSLFDNNGSYNTGLGSRTLESIGTGSYNTAVGAISMYVSENAHYNTAVGAYAMRDHKRNNYNTAIGYYSMYADTSGAYNTAVGSNTLKSNINGDNNTALGFSALGSSTGAGDNTALGYQVLTNATGGRNTAVGSKALINNTEGNYNSAFGYRSANSNTTGGYNTSVGDSSLYSNTTGFLNVAIGHGAMFANTISGHSVAIGVAAMKKTDGGVENTAVGDSALYSNVGGSYNTALGNSSLQENVGSRNTAVGNNALRKNSGTVNTALGHEALKINTTGYFNSAIGGYALSDLTEGNNNTAVGYNAGKGITTGDNNTIIGANITGLNSDLSNNIIIADGSGNQRIRVLSDGKVGIGTSTPDTKLNVYSTAAAEPIAHFQSDDDVSVVINGQGGESYVEIQNDDTGTSNSWKVGLNDNDKLSIQYGSEGTMNSDTEGLKISTEGYIYKPKMPYFKVVSNASTIISNGGIDDAIINFNIEHLDNGNNFDLSTDKFTAPVHGMYMFSWQVMHNDGQDMGGVVEYFYPGRLTTSDNTTDEAFEFVFQETDLHNSYSQSVLIELNSGEEVWIVSFAFGQLSIAYAQFSGYLVTALE